MTKKVLLAVAAVVAVVVVAVAVGVAVFFVLRGPDLSEYDKFREPTIVTMPNQKMLVIEQTGAPGQVAGTAFGALLSTYFDLEGVPKGFGMPAPRARWPISADVPKEQWLGRYAMPVPDSVTNVPAPRSADQPAANLVVWEYGEVAQVLYVGPYDQEVPTIERLKAFIRAQGYEITGEHEEEYLKGPGMFGRGNPEKYVTLIRYAIKKAPPAAAGNP